MKTRICDVCGKEKDTYGGKVCKKGHFTCKDCYYARFSCYCALCGTEFH